MTESGGSGTCQNGEIPGCGVIFEVNATGTLHVLYSFKGGTDGAYPAADFFYDGLGPDFFGTTEYGGSGVCSNGVLPGCGTVFLFSPPKEQRLYSFKGGNDGAFPVSKLVGLDVMRRTLLFGTTKMGGGTGCGGGGCGTIFSLNPFNGKEKVVYRFRGGTDGAYPAGLTVLNRMLYGTTESGGSGCAGLPCGTVYEVSAAGKERVIYSFKGGADGANPYAELIALNGKLYGTTEAGGTGNAGTVFEIQP